MTVLLLLSFSIHAWSQESPQTDQLVNSYYLIEYSSNGEGSMTKQSCWPDCQSCFWINFTDSLPGKERIKEAHPNELNVQFILEGQLPCQKISGFYTITKKGAISLNPVVGAKSCSKFSEIHTEIMKLFSEVDHYEVEGDNLIMSSSNSARLFFQRTCSE